MKKTLIAAALAGMAFSLSAVADTGIGAGIKIGTLGVGIDITKAITSSIDLRGNINYLNYDKNLHEGGVSYQGNIKLASVGALADWRPFHNGFRLSGGLYLNKNRASLNANQDGGVITLGDDTYLAGDAGVDSVNASVKFASVAPYLGLGWGGAISSGSRWGLIADLGVLYQGSPKVSLNANCGAQLDAANCNLVKQEAETVQSDLASDLGGLKWYPVASVGVSYKF